MKQTIFGLYSYQPLVAECLEKKISESRHLSLLAKADLHENVAEVAARRKPAFFVLDCGKPDRGISLLHKIRKASPVTQVIFFTGIENAEHAAIAMDGGAAGYISSACTKIAIVDALELIAAGQSFVSPHIAALVIKHLYASTAERRKLRELRMNHREEQISKLLLKGQTNRAIADGLGLSEKTVKYHMTNLMQKFHASNRVELAMALPRAREVAHSFQ